MSIYATLWEIKIPKRHCFDDEWIEVVAQAVPAHIGHPSHYPDGDLYADFLPPVVDYDPLGDESPVHRAVVLVKGDSVKVGQCYVDPLIVMTGKDYLETPFHVLLDRIQKAVGWDDGAIAMFIAGGKKKIIYAKRESLDHARL